MKVQTIIILAILFSWMPELHASSYKEDMLLLSNAYEKKSSFKLEINVHTYFKGKDLPDSYKGTAIKSAHGYYSSFLGVQSVAGEGFSLQVNDVQRQVVLVNSNQEMNITYSPQAAALQLDSLLGDFVKATLIDSSESKRIWKLIDQSGQSEYHSVSIEINTTNYTLNKITFIYPENSRHEKVEVFYTLKKASSSEIERANPATYIRFQNGKAILQKAYQTYSLIEL